MHSTHLLGLFQSTLPLRGATVRGFEHLVPAEISIHTPLAGSDLAILCQASRSPKFQSTLPLRGATRFGSSRSAMSPFQSTLLLRERPSSVMTAWSSILFQSTLPLRGATRIPKELWDNYRISIHVPLAGSDSFGKRISACRMISIHVPLAGSDKPLDPPAPPTRNFNPRSPCGERPDSHTVTASGSIFQSTFPLRGATFPVAVWRYAADISIHVPLAGSDIVHQFGFVDRLISIHAPLAGSDPRTRPSSTRTTYFNPHSPCGERRGEGVGDGERDLISIHAPLAGSDQCHKPMAPCLHDFNPRSPCRERLFRRIRARPVCVFQSTLPLRGATVRGLQHFVPAEISIHAPLAGSDAGRFRARFPRCYFNPRSPCGERLRRSRFASHTFNFNPRSPCGERPATWSQCALTLAISIHAPLAGSDPPSARILPNRTNFNPRSPCGERPQQSGSASMVQNFNPRSPCGERPLFRCYLLWPGYFNPRSPCGERP